MKRRQFLSMAAAGLGAAGLAGCGLNGSDSSESGGEKVRLAWWGPEARHQRTQKVIDLFTAKHSDVEVTPEFSGFQGYFEKLATQTAGGNAPDTFQMLVEYVPEYAGRNALLDLSSYEGDGLDLSAVDKDSVNGGRINGKLVAVSFGDNSPAVFYSKSKMTGFGLTVPEFGWTWDDLERIGGDVIRKSGGSVYGSHDFSGVNYALEIWLRQRGKEMYTPDNKLGFDKSDLTTWFEFWADLRKAKILVPADVMALFKGNNSDIPMIKGLSVNFVNYPNLLPGLSTATKDELVLTSFPKDTAQKRPGTYIKAVNWLGAFARSTNKDATVSLMDFILNDVEAGRALGVDRGVPPSAKVRDAIKGSLPPVEKSVVDYIDLVRQEVTPQNTPAPKGAGTVYAELIKAGEDVAFGKASISEGVDRLFAEAERALR